MVDAFVWCNSIVIASVKLGSILVAFTLLRGLIWVVNTFILLPLFDPLRILPGPHGKLLQSHFREVMDPNVSPDTHAAWLPKYGHTFRFHGFGRHDYRLFSFDLRVISHILTSPAYEKPWQTRQLLSRLIGKGIFSTEGAKHKIQRKIISPAFSTQSIKHVTPSILQQANELCATWAKAAFENSASNCMVPAEEPEKGATTTIDVLHWISRVSFDTIGLTGFDYHFRALEEESEPVYLAYRRLFGVADKNITLRTLVDLYFPWVRKIWPGKDNIIIDESLKIINLSGRKLIENKKLDLVNNYFSSEKGSKDLLGLLIKSNLSSDPTKRLGDQELLEQCSTFLLAGGDSVAMAISWTLHFLSLDTTVQDRLRRELTSAINGASDASDNLRTTSTPTLTTFPADCWDCLNSLPLLDAVVRESLRFCPPVHATIRVATRDDQIPISLPIKLRDGTTLQPGDHITIRKGSHIQIPIEGLNYSEELWGPGARSFNPDRWFNIPPQMRYPAYPGLGNSMTFSFGPHSCLGYKLTIAEMKIFISTLIVNFIFTPTPGIKIRKHNSILTKPFVKGKWDMGSQLPLTVQMILRND